MKAITRKNLLGLFTMLTIFLPVFQGFVPNMPGYTEETKTIVGAVVLLVTIIVMQAKNVISVEINSGKAFWATVIAGGLAVLGGAGDFFNVWVTDELLNQRIIFWLNVVTAMVSLCSKIFFPTDQTQSKF